MRRRSRNVRLITMGTVILSACGPDLPNDRYVYLNHQQCAADWGDSNCQHSTVSHGAGTYCYGPHYGSSVRLPSGEIIRAGSAQNPSVRSASGGMLGANAVPISRGGFGTSARSFSSGS